jgi:hypothetical protein
VDDHHVALRDEELARVLDIEGGKVGDQQLLECLAALDWFRGKDHMAHVVRG